MFTKMQNDSSSNLVNGISCAAPAQLVAPTYLSSKSIMYYT